MFATLKSCTFVVVLDLVIGIRQVKGQVQGTILSFSGKQQRTSCSSFLD